MLHALAGRSCMRSMQAAANRIAPLLCRFDQLRDLIPHKDKLDKAAFLQKTIDYICQLQVTGGPWSSACPWQALLTRNPAQGVA